VGPVEAALRQQHPEVRWLGMLERTELKEVYAAADVFEFPSRSETFGLVMLEAMACGTPVAAFPVDGPLQVLGSDEGVRGGVLSEDLQAACLQALEVPREQARARAMDFGWKRAADLFEAYLVPARPPAAQDAAVSTTPALRSS
jgi:glycosyltransferase involved in cell wall biosynthesis